jgi:hypothetical protein
VGLSSIMGEPFTVACIFEFSAVQPYLQTIWLWQIVVLNFIRATPGQTHFKDINLTDSEPAVSSSDHSDPSCVHDDDDEEMINDEDVDEVSEDDEHAEEEQVLLGKKPAFNSPR